MTGQTLSERDRHLFGPGQKRILSLDGGGIRGILSIAFLEKMDALLSKKRTAPFHDHFDLIGGTSTGSIIGAGLALGMSPADLRGLYTSLSARIFKKSPFRIMGLHSKFHSAGLERELHTFVGDRRLDSEDLKTGLCILAKRFDTGSAWIMANNPKGKYWQEPQDGSYIGNRAYPLAKLIRASTAAPGFFEPEAIDVLGKGQDLGVFVDGGTTPHNNPALSLLMLAALPQHGLGWDLGPDKLTVVSLGTGSFRPKILPAQLRKSLAISLIIRTLQGLIADSTLQTVATMQALGETPTPWIINSEVGAMAGMKLPGGPLFRHVRYDIRIEKEWLKTELGITLDDDTIARLRRMDDPDNIPLLYEIGQAAAEKQVDVSHFT